VKYDKPKRSYESKANPGKLASPKLAFDTEGAMHGLRVAGLPALGGVLGAVAAGGLGMDPITGEVLGASLGAMPEVIRAIRARKKMPSMPASAPKMAQADPYYFMLGGLEKWADKNEEALGLGAGLTLGGMIGERAGSRLGSHNYSKLHGAMAAEGALPGAEQLYERVRAASPVPVAEVPNFHNAMFNPGGSVVDKAERLGGIFGEKVREAAREVASQTPIGQAQTAARAAGVNIEQPNIMMGSGFKQPSILSHELGHSELNRGVGRLLQNRVTSFAHEVGKPIAGVVGLGTALASDDPRVQAAGALGGAALTLPGLGYEGLASFKGLRRLREAGATPEQLQHASRVLKNAFGTYGGRSLAAVGAGVAGTGLGIGGKAIYRGMKGEEKAAAELTPAQRLKQTQEVGRVDSVQPKDVAKLQTFKPPAMKLAFTESEFSGGLGPYHPFIMRNPSFQSSLPGNPNKYAGPDPEEEDGEPERYPSKDEKRASLWKAAHFACSAVGTWEKRAAPSPARLAALLRTKSPEELRRFASRVETPTAGAKFIRTDGLRPLRGTYATLARTEADMAERVRQSQR
jgi:hypothetical protein